MLKKKIDIVTILPVKWSRSVIPELIAKRPFID